MKVFRNPIFSDRLIVMIKKVRKEWSQSFDALFHNNDWIEGEERQFWQFQFEFWDISDKVFTDEWKGDRAGDELLNLFDKYDRMTESMAESGLFPEFSALYFRVAKQFEMREE